MTLNSENGGRFQVGEPNDLQPDDPWFATLEEAIESAEHLAKHCDNGLIAIWNDRSDCERLLFQGCWFKAE